jgi:hypothetical protein
MSLGRSWPVTLRGASTTNQSKRGSVCGYEQLRLLFIFIGPHKSKKTKK